MLFIVQFFSYRSVKLSYMTIRITRLPLNFYVRTLLTVIHEHNTFSKTLFYVCLFLMLFIDTCSWMHHMSRGLQTSSKCIVWKKKKIKCGTADVKHNSVLWLKNFIIKYNLNVIVNLYVIITILIKLVISFLCFVIEQNFWKWSLMVNKWCQFVWK